MTFSCCSLICYCWFVDAQAQYSLLQSMGTKMDSLYTELAEYFVFDRRKYTLEELFSDLKIFKDKFKEVWNNFGFSFI